MTWEISIKARTCVTVTSAINTGVSVSLCLDGGRFIRKPINKSMECKHGRRMREILTAGINSSTGFLTEYHSCLRANYKHVIFTVHWPLDLLFVNGEGIRETFISNYFVTAVNLDKKLLF